MHHNLTALRSFCSFFLTLLFSPLIKSCSMIRLLSLCRMFYFIITLMFKVYMLLFHLSSTIFVILLLSGILKFNLPCHTERKSHFCHKEYNGCTSIADKRQRNSCVRHQVYHNRNIQDNLQCNVDKNTADHQRPKHIRCILRNKK